MGLKMTTRYGRCVAAIATIPLPQQKANSRHSRVRANDGCEKRSDMEAPEAGAVIDPGVW